MPPRLSDTGLLVIRIVMTVVLGIGVLYGLLIMNTFQRYGTVMDKAWKQRIDEWIAEKAAGNIDSYAYRPGPNQLAPQPNPRVPQPSHGGTTSDTNPGATPLTLNPKVPVGTAEEFPPRIIPERTLYPIPEYSITTPSQDESNAR